MTTISRHIIHPIVDRIDRVRGITPEQRQVMRIERARYRYLNKATGPSHGSEINAVFDRELDRIRS